MLSSHLRLGLPNGLFPSGFPTKTFVYIVMKHRILQQARNCLTNCSIASRPVVNNSWRQFHIRYHEISSVFISRVIHYIVNLFVYVCMKVFVCVRALKNDCSMLWETLSFVRKLYDWRCFEILFVES
jgi:hypothetical protein